MLDINPQESLAERHKELLDTDDNIAIKVLDMAYKVKVTTLLNEAYKCSLRGR